MKKTINIEDSYIDILNEKKLEFDFEKEFETSDVKSLITLNENTIDLAFKDDIILESLLNSDFVLCYNQDINDGEYEGIGFFESLLLSLADKNVVLLSSNEEIELKFLEFIQQNYPKIRVVGSKVCEEETEDAVLNFVNNYAPIAVLGLLTSPSQERLLSLHKDHMNTRLIVGFGAKPEFLGYARASKGLFKDKNKVKVDLEALEVSEETD